MLEAMLDCNQEYRKGFMIRSWFDSAKFDYISQECNFFQEELFLDMSIIYIHVQLDIILTYSSLSQVVYDLSDI